MDYKQNDLSIEENYRWQGMKNVQFTFKVMDMVKMREHVWESITYCILQYIDEIWEGKNRPFDE